MTEAKPKGQVTLTTIIIGGAFTLAASAITAFATASNSIADVRTEVRVVQERENNHYEEVQKQLTEINAKLDRALAK